MRQVLCVQAVARVKIAGMLDQSLAHFEGEVETAKARVSRLEVLDDSQRVEVVIE